MASYDSTEGFVDIDALPDGFPHSDGLEYGRRQAADTLTLIARGGLSGQPSPDWRQRANCQGSDTNLFYSLNAEDKYLAQTSCGGCPVKQECLEYAVSSNERYGVWGGVDFSIPRERKIAKAILMDMGGIIR